MNIQNLIQKNIAQWGKFIMNLLSLIIAGIIYSFFIINFFIKTYIPGDVLYPDNPCKEPYVRLKESKNPFEKINPFEEMDAIESQLYSSRYQFCPKDSGEDVLKKYKDQNNEEEINTFLANAKQSSKLNLDFMFINHFRTLNKSRAGKVNYHGILQEFALLMLVSYFKTSVTIKNMFRRVHNVISALDIAQPVIFAIMLFIILIGYVFLNLRQDTGKSFQSMFIAISMQLLSLIIYITFFFIFVIGIAAMGISGFINIIYAFFELPLTSITGIGGVLIALCVFALSFFHAFAITAQFFKLFGLDVFFNIRNTNRIIGFLQKSQYINWSIIIFAFLSIILASINLSTTNFFIWLLTLFIYAMYKMFGQTNDIQNNELNKEKTNNVTKFIESLKKIQKKGSQKNTEDEDSKEA